MINFLIDLSFAGVAAGTILSVTIILYNLKKSKK